MLLLNIDTATDYASICISNGTDIVAMEVSEEQKNHASFVQPAIAGLLRKQGIQLSGLDAVSVTIGPGSYTGLRVGLASAKGICYALNKPLITVNTLLVMARAALEDGALRQISLPAELVFCPLIDARRMEVFTAAYDSRLSEIMAPQAMVLDALSFGSLYENHRTVFSGNGHGKLQNLLATHPNVLYSPVQHHAGHLARQAVLAYQSAHFADLAYAEPLYVKEFFDTSKPKAG